MERDVPHILYAHHHHAGDPEEENVIPRLHHAGGIEVAQVLSLFRPSKGGVGDQRGTEPSVQHIRVPFYHMGATLPTGSRVVVDYRDPLAVPAVPDRDAVTPPELPADAPVLNVLHPVVVDLREMLRDDSCLTISHGIESRFCQ